MQNGTKARAALAQVLIDAEPEETVDQTVDRILDCLDNICEIEKKHEHDSLEFLRWLRSGA